MCACCSDSRDSRDRRAPGTAVCPHSQFHAHYKY